MEETPFKMKNHESHDKNMFFKNNSNDKLVKNMFTFSVIVFL